MRNNSLFWGLLLIAIGGLFALQAMGLIKDVANFIWPLFLMALGAWILMGRFFGAQVDFQKSDTFSVELQNAARVEFDLDHGAGQVQVTGGAPAGVALSGIQATGMEFKSRLEADVLSVDVDAGPSFLPFLGPEGGAWVFKLTNEVPVNLDVDAGAATMSFDLTGVKLLGFNLDTGASSTSLVLPAEGQPYVKIESGAASLDITVPVGMAARIHVDGGASSLSVEPRFASISSGLYQSADYETAINRVEMRLSGGASSISIHS